MPVNYPKFDKKIQDQIDLSGIRTPKTRPGTIMGYDSSSNVATVVLDEQYSDSIGNVVNNVPCPVIRGVQTVAPTIGSRCLIGFRDNNESNPYIVNFIDDTVSKSNSYRETVVRTGIPKFMVH
jgi:hypothetical protein